MEVIFLALYSSIYVWKENSVVRHSIIAISYSENSVVKTVRYWIVHDIKFFCISEFDYHCTREYGNFLLATTAWRIEDCRKSGNFVITALNKISIRFSARGIASTLKMGVYSYIHVLLDRFLFKLNNLNLIWNETRRAEHECMNVPPPQLTRSRCPLFFGRWCILYSYYTMHSVLLAN